MEASSPSSQPPGGGPRRLAFLDIMRGVAILLVVVFHALGSGLGMDHAEWSGRWLDLARAPRTLRLLLPMSFGWIGVAVFFAVSGFCIHLSHERSPGREWKAFFLRRFFRIYPPYLLALCFFALAIPLTNRQALGWEHLAQFGSHLFLVHNAHPHTLDGINGAFWSIAVEVQLYLIYPLLLLTARRLGWGRALLLAGGVEGTLRLANLWFDLPCWVCNSPFFFWLSWGAGAKLADDYLQGRPLFLGRWPLWPFATATVLSFCFQPASGFSFLLAALTTVRAIAGCLAQPGRPALSSRLAQGVSWVGTFSYSLYLVHMPLMHAFVRCIKGATPHHPLHPLLLVFCALASCLFIFPGAWLFCREVELKSVAYGKRFVRRRSRAPSDVPATFAR